MMQKTKIFIFSLVVMVVAGFTFFAAGPSFAYTDDIISLWTLDENPAAANTYEDYYGINDGLGNPDPIAVPADGINGAQEFTGTQGIDVAANASFDWLGTDSFSIEVWIKTDGNDPASRQVVVGRDDTVGGVGLQWWVSLEPAPGATLFSIQDAAGPSNNAALTGVSISDDTDWHHVVVTRDGSSGDIELYIDGDLQDTENVPDFTAGLSSATEGINIGYLNTGGLYRFDGLLDEVAIYDRALPESEIDDHFAAGTAGKSVTTIGDDPGPATPSVTTHSGGGGGGGCFISSIF